MNTSEGPFTAAKAMAGGETHLIVIVLLLPFVAVFLRAAWLEYRRWRIHGASNNLRSRYPIDTTAPSYDLPEPQSK
ncbi:hypothetical protein [Marinibacterium profundimaris]|uniref:Uncharacterized protein n=1 Tax=Marinibacterium profundimaris TaxID=1679460 RepID=A0A225NKH7_9RHOB|nr:hypothetical protein [Marinibacterium profundimaris]OWU74698.1 hypothetical protein ATO3_08715 [Marinibacterium profundimaris]